MKNNVLFLSIILLNCFFNSQASFLQNFYAQNYQLVNTLGAITLVSVTPGLCIKKWLEKPNPNNKRVNIKDAIFLGPLMYFATNDGKRTAKETIGQFLGLLPIAYILSRSYDGKLNRMETVLSILSTFVIRMSIG